MKSDKLKLKKEIEEPAEGSFAALIKDFFAKVPKVGDIIKGKVISVDSGAVRLDINGLTTGVIRGHELFTESREFANVKLGDEVEATIIEQENENGEMELSFRSAGHQRVWDRMTSLMKDGLTISSKVLAANKGGLMMQVDAISGFMPVSQLNPDHYPRVPGGDKQRILEQLRLLAGKEFQVKVIDVNQKENKLIVSEKAVWEDEQKAVLDSYKIGDIVSGEISALTSFGAFVKFGEGLEGLVHISEIVWQRIDHPKDVLKIGDQVKAQIIDLNKSKIYLSMKRLVEDPWKAVKDKYKVGQVVKGTVHKVEPFGLMVKLDDDIHGLAHISELSDEAMADMKLVKDRFAIGEVYSFEIVSIEPAEHRLGLKIEGVKGKRPKKAEKAKEEKDAEEEKEEVKEEKEKA
ncbi:MAG: S1 RNA-binding domain-containing protein [Patescibacteria group bacterium]